TLDCSGKEAFASTRRGWRITDPYLNKIAVWTYYKGSKRETGIDEGTTTVAYVPDKGWFWHIPQHNDMVSVGVVAESKYLTRDGVKDPRTIFEREIEENQWIKDRLATGQSIENMRKLVYAFYDPNFSFKKVITRFPEAADQITDCLSGDVNKDFSQLWSWIREFVPLPEDLPYGEPLVE